MTRVAIKAVYICHFSVLFFSDASLIKLSIKLISMSSDHLQIVADRHKRFPCKVCGRIFRSDKLARHLKTHEKKQKYPKKDLQHLQEIDDILAFISPHENTFRWRYFDDNQ